MAGSRAAFQAVLLGFAVVGVAAVSALADTVPLPRPAPFPKIQSAAAVPAHSAMAQTRPGAAIQTGPDVTGSTAQNKPSPVIPNPFAALLQQQPGQTTMFDASQRAMIEKVNASLTAIRTLVGDFVQVGPDGKRTEGEFYLAKPGRVRFEYDAPSPIELIADGQSVVVRDRKLATQDVYPLSQTPLRFLLADRIDLLRDTSVVKVSADDVFVTIVIEEKQAIGGTHRLMLMFDAKNYQLKQWTVTDPQGYDTTVAVYNLDTTKKPDPNLFKIDYTRYPN